MRSKLYAKGQREGSFGLIKSLKETDTYSNRLAYVGVIYQWIYFALTRVKRTICAGPHETCVDLVIFI